MVQTLLCPGLHRHGLSLGFSVELSFYPPALVTHSESPRGIQYGKQQLAVLSTENSQPAPGWPREGWSLRDREDFSLYGANCWGGTVNTVQKPLVHEQPGAPKGHREDSHLVTFWGCTQNFFSLSTLTATSRLWQMANTHQNPTTLRRGKEKCVLQEFIKIYNLHIAASI